MQLLDPALDVLQVLPELAEGLVHGGAAVVHQVDPAVHVPDHGLQVLQLGHALLVLLDQPLRALGGRNQEREKGELSSQVPLVPPTHVDRAGRKPSPSILPGRIFFIMDALFTIPTPSNNLKLELYA